MTRRRIAAPVVLLVGLLAGWFVAGLPSRKSVRALGTDFPGETSVMRQRAKEAIAAKRAVRRQWTVVPIARISRHLIHAVLASEDPKFFGHEGVDWEAIQASIEANIERGEYARGGSTITQQLAKNLFFTTRKSLVRKARELAVTRWLEADLTKKRIIELYLNVIEWGDGVYGCEAAARRYYRVSCAALDEAQAAGLAAMIPSPRRINPRVNPGLHARATRRVLWLMRGAGYLKREIRYLGRDLAPEPNVEVDEKDPEPAEAEAEPPELTPEPMPESTLPPPPSPSPITFEGAIEPSPAPTPKVSPDPGTALRVFAAPVAEVRIAL
jgi:monofunctional biosynthetic peptidoglycan transglycosylase